MRTKLAAASPKFHLEGDTPTLYGAFLRNPYYKMICFALEMRGITVGSDNGQQEAYSGNQFKSDVFVSYSHGARATTNGKESDLKKWTVILIEKLREHVHYSLKNQKKQIEVWYDKELLGNQNLNETLKNEVKNSAILLIIMTHDYLNSEWCHKELSWFEREIGRRKSDLDNIFVVRAMPTNDAEWPDCLKDGLESAAVGFEFCDGNKGRGSRPFGWVDPSHSSTQKAFTDALTGLALAIATKLDALRNTSGCAEAKTTFRNHRPKIAIAPPTDDVRAFTKEIRSILSDDKYDVQPREDLLASDLDSEKEDKIFKNADLFVQAIGMSSARSEGEKFGRVQILGDRAESEGLRRLFWRKERFDIDYLEDDPEYKKYVESLGDILSCAPEEFVKKINHCLSEEKPKFAGDDHITAFLELPEDAFARYEELYDEISVDNCLLFPRKPPDSNRIKDIQRERRARRAIFSSCNAVLFLYCVPDRLKWLAEAVINCEKDFAVVHRAVSRRPETIIVDSVGEAVDVGDPMGVETIRWEKGCDPKELWSQIRGIAS